MERKDEILSILIKHKNEEYNTEQATKKILLLFGVIKSVCYEKKCEFFNEQQTNAVCKICAKKQTVL